MAAEPVTLDLSHINYSALTEPIARAQIRAFRAQTRAAERANPGIRTGARTASSILAVIFLVFFAVVFFFVFSSVITTIVEVAGFQSSSIVELVVLLLFVAFAVALVVSHFGSRGPWAKWMRLTQFAQANGLQFRASSTNPNYPGMIFVLGDSRSAYDHFNTTAGRYLDFGDYTYTTGSGKSRSTHRWGFLAFQLDRELPNMVLDSKENNELFGISDLPVSFNRSQILSLEGDFDQHFTLYCPQEYEQDALYVFTPDLMALLIDDAGSFDVEIVDNWMFVYSPKPFPPLSQANYARLFTIVQTVGSKTLSQTENYHDDRVASPAEDIVAPQGQRLRHGTSISALIFCGVFAAFWLFGVFHGYS